MILYLSVMFTMLFTTSFSALELWLELTISRSLRVVCNVNFSLLAPRSSLPEDSPAESAGAGELRWRASGHRPGGAPRPAAVQHRAGLGARPQDAAPTQVCSSAQKDFISIYDK